MTKWINYALVVLIFLNAYIYQFITKNEYTSRKRIKIFDQHPESEKKFQIELPYIPIEDRKTLRLSKSKWTDAKKYV